MGKGFLTIAIALSFAGSANAQGKIEGDYICTVTEKASIASIHLEDAGPPKAIVDDQLPTRFKLRIARSGQFGDKFRLIEVPYNGDDRDLTDWHTTNSVLHGPYVGNGKSFLGTGDNANAFFVLGPTIHSNDDGVLAFYHSGFEWAGGEDTKLSIRWGRCKLN